MALEEHHHQQLGGVLSRRDDIVQKGACDIRVSRLFDHVLALVLGSSDGDAADSDRITDRHLLVGVQLFEREGGTVCWIAPPKTPSCRSDGEEHDDGHTTVDAFEAWRTIQGVCIDARVAAARAAAAAGRRPDVDVVVVGVVGCRVNTGSTTDKKQDTAAFHRLLRGKRIPMVSVEWIWGHFSKSMPPPPPSQEGTTTTTTTNSSSRRLRQHSKRSGKRMRGGDDLMDGDVTSLWQPKLDVLSAASSSSPSSSTLMANDGRLSSSSSRRWLLPLHASPYTEFDPQLFAHVRFTTEQLDVCTAQDVVDLLCFYGAEYVRDVPSLLSSAGGVPNGPPASASPLLLWVVTSGVNKIKWTKEAARREGDAHGHHNGSSDAIKSRPHESLVGDGWDCVRLVTPHAVEQLTRRGIRPDIPPHRL